MEQEKQRKKSGTTDHKWTAYARPAVLIALALVVVFAAMLCGFSLRNESLRKKCDVGYNGVLQQESIYPMDIDAKQQSKKVRETKRHGQTLKFRYLFDV